MQHCDTPYICLSSSHNSGPSPNMSPSRLAPILMITRWGSGIHFHQCVLTAFMSTTHNLSLPFPPEIICVAKIVFHQGAFTGCER